MSSARQLGARRADEGFAEQPGESEAEQRQRQPRGDLVGDERLRHEGEDEADGGAREHPAGNAEIAASR